MKTRRILFLLVLLTVLNGCAEKKNIDNYETDIKKQVSEQQIGTQIRNKNMSEKREQVKLSGIQDVFSDFFYLGKNNIAYADTNNQIVVYNLFNGNKVKTFARTNNDIFSQKVSYIDNGIIVYGIEENRALLGTSYADIYYTDLTSKHLNFEECLEDVLCEYEAVRLSRDENSIIYVSKDNKIKLYHIDTKQSDEICDLKNLYIVNMEFSWDGTYIVFSGKKTLENGAEKKGFGVIDIDGGKINFYEDEWVDNKLMVTQEGVFLQAKAVLESEEQIGSIYRVTNKDYKKIEVENNRETQKVNVTQSGKYFTTQIDGVLKLYQVGQATPVSAFADEQYGINTVAANALLLEEQGAILCSYSDENGIRTYCYQY